MILRNAKARMRVLEKEISGESEIFNVVEYRLCIQMIHF